jgi:hypothetical protein
MSVRRLSLLQWAGFLGGGVVWFPSFLLGTGASQAACNPASARWGIPHDTVQLVLMVVAASLVCAAQAAAIAVFRATRSVDEQAAPPEGRLRFFSIAAMLGNLLFFGVILLTGIATIVDRACHQA